VGQRAAKEAPPRTRVQPLRRIVQAAADLVDHDAPFLAKAILAHLTVIELLGQEAERIAHVFVEDLEGQRNGLIPGVGVVFASQLCRATVECYLVERRGTLEEHVLRHVGDAGMPTVETRSSADAQGNGGERPGDVLMQHA